MRVFLVFALAACGFRSPSASTDGAGTDVGTTPGSDASSVGSCAGETMSGQRVCVDASHAASCELNSSSGMYDKAQVDRECPPGSTCMNGHCAPPSGATSCSKPADCPSNICDLFVVGGTIQGVCATAFPGGTGPYSSCSPPYGNNTGCATGLCALDGEDSSHRQCLFGPCTSNSTCPSNQSCHLLGQPTTLEGVSFPVGFKACFN